MEEGEQAEARDKHDNNRQDAAESGKQSPGQDNKLGGSLAQALLKHDELHVQDPAGEQAPGDRELQQGDGVNAKGALVRLERRGREDAASRGRLGGQDQEYEELQGYLDKCLKSWKE